MTFLGDGDLDDAEDDPELPDSDDDLAVFFAGLLGERLLLLIGLGDLDLLLGGDFLGDRFGLLLGDSLLGDRDRLLDRDRLGDLDLLLCGDLEGCLLDLSRERDLLLGDGVLLRGDRDLLLGDLERRRGEDLFLLGDDLDLEYDRRLRSLRDLDLLLDLLRDRLRELCFLLCFLSPEPLLLLDFLGSLLEDFSDLVLRFSSPTGGGEPGSSSSFFSFSGDFDFDLDLDLDLDLDRDGDFFSLSSSSFSSFGLGSQSHLADRGL